MSQGYQIIATGHQKYLDMAMNCARSLKLFDPDRPIQLVTDLTVSQSAIDIYDFITPLSTLRLLWRPSCKARDVRLCNF